MARIKRAPATEQGIPHYVTRKFAKYANYLDADWSAFLPNFTHFPKVWDFKYYSNSVELSYPKFINYYRDFRGIPGAANKNRTFAKLLNYLFNMAEKSARKD